MLEILSYDFMKNALLAGILVSIACGVVGTYVVVKGISFISGSISHAAYGGIGLGYYLGINPMLGATIFTVLSALGMGIVSHKTKQKEDTIIGMMWAVGMALGIIFIKLSPGYTADLMSYLFGSILTVPVGDLWLMLLLDLIIVLIVLLFYESFKLVAFDEEYAETLGLNTLALNLLLLFLIALTVVVMIRAVGIILVIALLTIPAAIARQLSKRLPLMMVLATLLGIVFAIVGLLLSYLWDLPSGATIILCAAGGFIISSLITSNKKTNIPMVSGEVIRK
ncbi:MAG TPA: iron chelate uptake ABC transporter family permease subunit [Syntrophomonadaceae bacterium]|nr:iron chelate uptake ABC transporter family permease subunit [Syntrophomonadaceae bacterium]